MCIRDRYMGNLDPYGIYSEDQLLGVIKKVKLDSVLAEKGGMDFVIRENGGNLSAGERQLLSLGRALLNRSRVVVMDEATANVDGSTEKKIIETVADVFSQCTVIVIAHRMATVEASNCVIVLDKGRIVEFGLSLIHI
eukprot:TRINITY_DN5044_c0_g1_i1.p1 TRINITY_DN5044_c0_g1~~TRINITY_DN5044_c0_g1_i1.p1  ORF type:complete len:153 (-),score=35.98 TRINITY_DN5044_c0_g1_i1:59-472(-)